MNGALVYLQEDEGPAYLEGFPGGMDEARGYPDDAGLVDDVMFHLLAQVNLACGPEVGWVFGICADVEEQLAVLVDMWRGTSGVTQTNQ